MILDPYSSVGLIYISFFCKISGNIQIDWSSSRHGEALGERGYAAQVDWFHFTNGDVWLCRKLLEHRVVGAQPGRAVGDTPRNRPLVQRTPGSHLWLTAWQAFFDMDLCLSGVFFKGIWIYLNACKEFILSGFAFVRGIVIYQNHWPYRYNHHFYRYRVVPLLRSWLTNHLRMIISSITARYPAVN